MVGWRGVGIAALVISAVSVSNAWGQRRGAKTTPTKVLLFELPVAAEFGDVVVPAAHYRVSVSKRGLSLANPTTMVAVATLPMTDVESSTGVDVPTVEVFEKRGDVIQVIVKSRDRIYTAVGVKRAQATPVAPRIELAASHDAQLGEVLPAATSEHELIEQALKKRYIRDVKHCADKAHRSRWRTDDRRFWKCVCPMAQRWRLAKVTADLRVHYPLAPGKSGISITVTPKGRVKDCRVWVGAKPPADEQQGVKPAGAEPAAKAGAKADAKADVAADGESATAAEPTP